MGPDSVTFGAFLSFLSKIEFWSVSFITKVINETLQNQILVPICLLLVAFGSRSAHFGSISGLGSILSKKLVKYMCYALFVIIHTNLTQPVSNHSSIPVLPNCHQSGMFPLLCGPPRTPIRHVTLP